MNARAAASDIASKLRAVGIPDATFEAELLVRSAGGLTRSEFFAGAGLSAAQERVMDSFVARRRAREPFAYIDGKREFYGLDFEVTPEVLVPRPETEVLVEIGIEAMRAHAGATVADVGAGSGCVGVAVAHSVPQYGVGGRVVATDVSAAALAIAAKNAASNAVELGFIRTNLASAVGHADVVLANLPYIPSAQIAWLEPEVSRWEPRLALDGGVDGLDLIRRLILDCARRLRPSLLAVEVGAGQAPSVSLFGERLGACVSVAKDLAGIERVVCFRWE